MKQLTTTVLGQITLDDRLRQEIFGRIITYTQTFLERYTELAEKEIAYSFLGRIWFRKKISPAVIFTDPTIEKTCREIAIAANRLSLSDIRGSLKTKYRVSKNHDFIMVYLDLINTMAYKHMFDVTERKTATDLFLAFLKDDYFAKTD